MKILFFIQPSILNCDINWVIKIKNTQRIVLKNFVKEQKFGTSKMYEKCMIILVTVHTYIYIHNVLLLIITIY